ncbi:MAG: hypothetical protein F6K39_35800 [Okeania sp. SIO3B3]|nr:hypothetical protein [Okeania sp. SIO3B3]
MKKAAMLKAEGRGENYMGIVFDTPLRVYKPQAILALLKRVYDISLNYLGVRREERRRKRI